MKGQIVTQEVYASTLDFAHGMPTIATRLYIPDRGVALTLWQGQVLVAENFDATECEVVNEVEVPDDIVEQAVAMSQQNTALIESLSSYLPMTKA